MARLSAKAVLQLDGQEIELLVWAAERQITGTDYRSKQYQILVAVLQRAKREFHQAYAEEFASRYLI